MLIKAEKNIAPMMIKSFSLPEDLHKKITKYCKTGKFDMQTFFKGAAVNLFEQEDIIQKQKVREKNQKAASE